MERSTTCVTCHCVLARDNDEPMCSPCAARAGRERWRTVNVRKPSLTPGELEREGAAALAGRLQIDHHTMVAMMFESGFLPARMQRYASQLARLLELHHLSNVAAARELRVSRWTVASWRERLAGTNAEATLETHG